MASIRKRRQKWEVRVRRSGFKTVCKSFIKKADAEAWARQVEIHFDRGEAPFDERQKYKTFADIAERYLKEVSPTKKSFPVEFYRIPLLIKRPFAKMRLCELNGPTIASFRDGRIKEVSSASVRKEMYLISAIIQHANAEWLQKPIANPIHQIAKPKDSKPRAVRLSNQDRNKLLNALEASKHKILKSIILFALETGLRRGEILRIHWEDIDLSRGLLLLRETKNGQSRIVPLSPSAIKILTLLPRHEKSAFPISSNACRLAWERLRDKAALPNLRFHDLRHDAISRFFERGLTIPEVTMMSGHKTKSQLFRYAHADFTSLKKKLMFQDGGNL